ncbi:DUF2625 domain-containing protein [Dyadobacter jiangsuensis]
MIITLINGFGQQKQRPVEQLINKEDPGWPLVLEWAKKAINPVEILSADSANARQALYDIQVTTRSPMGAIVFMSGGILIDHGWIRILGSGNARLTRALSAWRKTIQLKVSKTGTPLLVVADDAIGGIFVLNDGSLGNDPGKIYYLAPDTLEFEALDLGYSDFLIFCFNNDLDKFYEGYRWKSWKEEISKMSGDSVIGFYPYLWTKEGKEIEKNSRRVIPVAEYYEFVVDFRAQLGLGK